MICKKIIRKLFNRIELFSSHPLTSTRPFPAIKRYAFYHLVHKFLPDAAIYPFVNGVRFLSKPGAGYLAHNIYVGMHDFEEMGFLLHFLRPEDCFVDVGANAGGYTLLAAGVAGAITVAIEPIPATYDLLLQNLRINNLHDAVHTYNLGIGAESGKLQFSTLKSDSINHVLLDNENDSSAIVVDVVGLDELLDQYSPSLIKIDVEGFEMPTLMGAVNTLKLATLKAIIIELNGSGIRYGFPDSTIHQFLTERGFQPYSYSPFDRRIIPLFTYNKHKPNTIYLRELEYVQNRVQHAKKFQVLNQSI